VVLRRNRLATRRPGNTLRPSRRAGPHDAQVKFSDLAAALPVQGKLTPPTAAKYEWWEEKVRRSAWRVAWSARSHNSSMRVHIPSAADVAGAVGIRPSPSTACACVARQLGSFTSFSTRSESCQAVARQFHTI
jgi:hypothetical protein